jgi:hypothetical protein
MGAVTILTRPGHHTNRKTEYAIRTIEWRRAMGEKTVQPVDAVATRKNRIFTGLMMVLGGIALYVSLRMDLSLNVQLIIGLAFLTMYFYRRNAGFLIPGCILLGLSIKHFMHTNFDIPRSSVLSLGLGFLSIFFISLAYERRTDYWWALIPGGLMVLSGWKGADEIRVFLFDNWPLLIIGIGIFILIGAFRKSATPPSSPPPGENTIE